MYILNLFYFLLTMWDVKPTTLSLALLLPANFLLTMWDVKFFICEWSWFPKINFLLTMWDVKYGGITANVGNAYIFY